MSSQWLSGEDVLADLDQLNEFYVKPFTKNDKILFDDNSKKILSASGSFGRGRCIESDLEDEQVQSYFGRGSSFHGRRSPFKINDDKQNEVEYNLRRACGDGYSNFLDEEYWSKKQGSTNNDLKKVPNRKITCSYQPKSSSNKKTNQLDNGVMDNQKILDGSVKKAHLNINATEFVPSQYNYSILEKSSTDNCSIQNEKINTLPTVNNFNQLELNVDNSMINPSQLSGNSISCVEDKYKMAKVSPKKLKNKKHKYKNINITNEINFVSYKDFLNKDMVLLPDVNKTSSKTLTENSKTV